MEMHMEKIMEKIKVNAAGTLFRPSGEKMGKFTDNGVTIMRGKEVVGRRDPETGVVSGPDGKAIGVLMKVPTRCLPKGMCDEQEQGDQNEDNAVDTIDLDGMSKEAKVAALDKILRKKEEEYCPGKDSALIVSGEWGNRIYGPMNQRKRAGTVAETALQEVNKKYGWSYDDWETLSASEDLTEKFLNEYENYVDWYGYLKAHPRLSFSEKFAKKHWRHLLVRTLQIV